MQREFRRIAATGCATAYCPTNRRQNGGLATAHDDLRHVALARHVQHGGHHIVAVRDLDLGTELTGDGHGRAHIAGDAGPLDRQGNQGRVQRIGHALGVAHHCFRRRIGADQRQHAFAGWPWAFDGAGAHVAGDVGIHALGRTAQAPVRARRPDCPRGRSRRSPGAPRRGDRCGPASAVCAAPPAAGRSARSHWRGPARDRARSRVRGRR